VVVSLGNALHVGSKSCLYEFMMEVYDA